MVCDAGADSETTKLSTTQMIQKPCTMDCCTSDLSGESGDSTADSNQCDDPGACFNATQKSFGSSVHQLVHDQQKHQT